ncbi:hypothetical protein [Natronobiforma cellulositropha]|uniref:hypothetical protein n=1 Tax=Natronobiforma cellulositropha TaxID=1679076 RepID=UPI0021D58EE3|nr:hypothetical protein [Natronobiforma cellulositropha]
MTYNRRLDIVAERFRLPGFVGFLLIAFWGSLTLGAFWVEIPSAQGLVAGILWGILFFGSNLAARRRITNWIASSVVILLGLVYIRIFVHEAPEFIGVVAGLIATIFVLFIWATYVHPFLSADREER